MLERDGRIDVLVNNAGVGFIGAVVQGYQTMSSDEFAAIGKSLMGI